MTKTKPTQMRLDDDTLKMLGDIAFVFGVSATDAVRMSVRNFHSDCMGTMPVFAQKVAERQRDQRQPQAQDQTQTIEYYLEDGTLVFSHPFWFRNAWGIGNELVHDYAHYIVTTVRFEGNRQIVTVKRQPQAQEQAQEGGQ